MSKEAALSQNRVWAIDLIPATHSSFFSQQKQHNFDDDGPRLGAAHHVCSREGRREDESPPPGDEQTSLLRAPQLSSEIWYWHHHTPSLLPMPWRLQPKIYLYRSHLSLYTQSSLKSGREMPGEPKEILGFLWPQFGLTHPAAEPANAKRWQWKWTCQLAVTCVESCRFQRTCKRWEYGWCRETFRPRERASAWRLCSLLPFVGKITWGPWSAWLVRMKESNYLALSVEERPKTWGPGDRRLSYLCFNRRRLPRDCIRPLCLGILEQTSFRKLLAIVQISVHVSNIASLLTYKGL